MSNKLILISLIVCLSLGIGLTALAQETTPQEVVEDETVEPEDLDTKEPKLLPDSPWYFIKEWGRGIQSFFTFGSLKKSALEQKFANERLMELQKLTEENAIPEILKKATEKYERALEKIKTRTEKIEEKAAENEEVEKFLDKFTKHQLLHQKILEKLETQVPQEVFEEIKQAREKHLERFGEVMTKLEDRGEKTKERLEKNLQEQEGSKFKNFKNLEVLIELEEKVQGQTKEAIQQAQTNVLKRLQEDLEKMSPEDQEKFKEYLEKISGDKKIQSQILEKVEQRIQNREELQQKLNEANEGILERIRVREREENQVNTNACINLWDPVCGKNGKTYSNECFAKAAGVEADYKGKCQIEEKCIKEGTDTELTLAEAKKIALSSECIQQGTLTATNICNENTGTWWIDLEPFEKKAGCNPACVVNVVTKEAEINWRCTGLIEPSDCALKCGGYRYSTCPEECIKRCVSGTCQGNICTSDCEGPGSCLCQ